ncbi:MAG: response regulator [Desulfobulbus sp.]|nr:response regulator [Desulfobulbus sp.]
MKLCRLRHPPTIAGKLRLGFGLIFLLVSFIMTTWVLSLHKFNQTRHTISDCIAIERTVLNMDRLLEKARRLHGDFCLQYDRIGLGVAHVQFAQPSIRLVAQAVSASSELKKMIAQTGVGKRLHAHQVDINLYLASAKRFADTSIQSIELITRLAAPDHGLEDDFEQQLVLLQQATSPSLSMAQLIPKAQLLYQQYRVNRQRPLMQSIFNILSHVNERLETAQPLAGISKDNLQALTIRLQTTGEEILVVDAEIKNKFNDFNLQTNTSQPIARMLVDEAAKEVAAAKEASNQTISGALLALAFCLLAACATGLFISRFISQTITRRIEALTQCAADFQQGGLNLNASEQPADELGQLGQTFNLMSARIRTTVDQLEQTIAERTGQLRVSEHRFRSIADQLPHVGIIGIDQHGKIFFWNRACHQLYGASDTQACGQRLEELIIDKGGRTLFAEQLAAWMHLSQTIEGERTFCHQNGTPVPVYVASFDLDTPDGSKEFYSIHLDLSELKQAEEQRALQTSIYRSLFEHISSGVGLLEAIEEGRDFIIKDANPAVERIEGYKLDEIKGQSLIACFPGVEPSGLLALAQEVWRSGQPAILHPFYYARQNRHRWREGHLYKIPSGEVVIVYDDITELKQGEQQREVIEAQLQRSRKMEAIGLLAGGVAHDLNNILSGIVSYPDLLLMQLAPDSKLRKPILAIQESGQRAAAVVADLLTVARGVSSEKKLCSLNQLVNQYLNSPEHEALLKRHPGVECQSECSKQIWPLPCSPIHIKKSLMNLMTNAAEAIDHSGLISIRTRKQELPETEAQALGVKPGVYVLLEVADSGSGIAKEDLDHIFEPFYTRKVMGRSGTGLGLAVVWNTIQDHQGGIAVSSSKQGTVFTLYFPATAQEALLMEDDLDNDIRQGNGETVLVVDDEPLQREIATQILDTLGYSSLAIASGEAAVDYLQDHEVDLVLLDMLMGTGINGRETYSRIAHRHPGQKALIVSGFSENEEVREALRLGVSAYLQKPYAISSLSRAVATALQPAA